MSGDTPGGEFLLYQSESGESHIQVRLDGGTVWLTQGQLAELYQTTPQNITQHIRAIYEEGEQAEAATCKDYLQVRLEGGREVKRRLKHYNLDLILAVGYRVRSHRGTQFRRWATAQLSEYLVKGFVMDDERLKEGVHLGRDYFDELLERIRDIRASEKRFYQKIRDIYALALDYDSRAETTQRFFQRVQNKLHWAITGMTAAEIIRARADATKPNMGLTSWKGGKVRRGDVTIAKNYLSDDELRQLNRIVNMYLDYAELQAERRQPIYIRDWEQKLDAFLQFNEQQVLQDAGRVRMDVAQRLALDEYETFHRHRLALEAQEAEIEELERAAKRLEGKE
jgi:hypothetical protein